MISKRTLWIEFQPINHTYKSHRTVSYFFSSSFLIKSFPQWVKNIFFMIYLLRPQNSYWASMNEKFFCDLFLFRVLIKMSFSLFDGYTFFFLWLKIAFSSHKHVHVQCKSIVGLEYKVIYSHYESFFHTSNDSWHGTGHCTMQAILDSFMKKSQFSQFRDFFFDAVDYSFFLSLMNQLWCHSYCMSFIAKNAIPDNLQ